MSSGVVWLSLAGSSEVVSNLDEGAVVFGGFASFVAFSPVGGASRIFGILFGASFFVLAIACSGIGSGGVSLDFEVFGFFLLNGGFSWFGVWASFCEAFCFDLGFALGIGDGVVGGVGAVSKVAATSTLSDILGATEGGGSGIVSSVGVGNGIFGGGTAGDSAGTVLSGVIGAISGVESTGGWLNCSE